MARRRSSEKRDVLPDPKFGRVDVARFVNVLMCDGKKSKAERVFYGALERLSKREGVVNSVDLFAQVVDAVRPSMEVKSSRLGGATYPVPVEVGLERGYALARRWIAQSARKRSESTMEESLEAEFWDISQKRGGAWKKKEDTEKMARSNRAFAHYRR